MNDVGRKLRKMLSAGVCKNPLKKRYSVKMSKNMNNLKNKKLPMNTGYDKLIKEYCID
ncbi:hypothetical protein [Anaeroarcus burkinensis]|uniref:hypothetical protein n=1 Tax=Anaeroarcus burkinensis TaxID=82376 RepID=UPI001AEC4D32|nr:hypothetical protein [Anaeroarcus burkinensis]